MTLTPSRDFIAGVIPVGPRTRVLPGELLPGYSRQVPVVRGVQLAQLWVDIILLEDHRVLASEDRRQHDLLEHFHIVTFHQATVHTLTETGCRQTQQC